MEIFKAEALHIQPGRAQLLRVWVPKSFQRKFSAKRFQRNVFSETFQRNVLSRFLVLEPHFESGPAWGLGLMAVAWGLGAEGWKGAVLGGEELSQVQSQL